MEILRVEWTVGEWSRRDGGVGGKIQGETAQLRTSKGWCGSPVRWKLPGIYRVNSSEDLKYGECRA